MTHLFLSPHYDDAVLSCGGVIHQLTQRGETVHILTVMGGDLPDPLPDTPIVRDLHQRWRAGHDPVAARREEDRRAAATLGAKASHLTYGDCVYRSSAAGEPLYPSEESLFGAVDPADSLRHIPPSLAIDADVSVIYVPLGIGHHVDHQIVRDWGLQLRGDGRFVLRFYSEYPYNTTTNAVDAALALVKQQIPGAALTREDVYLDDANVHQKIAAIACYESQISTFWQNIDTMARDVRDQLRRAGDGDYAEIYWIVETP